MIVALGIILVTGPGLAACRTGSAPSTPAASGTGGAGSAPSTPIISPLTGRPTTAGHPVLAVKIDNVGPARPQTGLTGADVIYVEPVEGGLSRILAVFSSTLPPRVGPVRSARESDIALLAQYGRVGLAFSGANQGVLAAVRGADLVELSPDRAASAYSRRGPHRAPHNLYADPAALLRKGTGVAAAKDVGFRFGSLPSGGAPTTGTVLRYPAASTGFTWSKTRRRWNVSLDGRAAATTDGGRLAPATVVVQHTRVTSSKYHDVLGNPTPFTETIGSGKAVVLRDGQSFTGTWSRPSASVGTTFMTPAGAPLTFAAGQVWVVFVNG
jgi:Protein of unknown function (DUF3048) N-terminal domain/Protein of unknown function (DUF3048) C-terminal domain